MTETCPNCGAELNVDNAAGGLCGRCLFERGIEFTSTLAVNIADGSTPGSPRFNAPDPVEVEADLLSFDVLELIGQGGMGAVYKAYQRNLDRTVAIKILPRQSAGGHEFAERFAREARALARLRHENIVMAYDYGLTDRYLYSVMEYVGGPNLRELLRGECSHLAPRDETSLPDESQCKNAEAIPPRRALEIARDVCAALQYAHDHGIVHRDIKPENVLLDESGRVKIADFGLAKLLQQDPRELALTHTRHFMGTLHYMAPEQCERPHETDHRADIYSVGVVLYEMLTGELPIGRFDPPSMRANIDPRLDELVLRALEKDASRRYATAAEFVAAIARELDTVAPGLVPAVAAGGHRLGRSMAGADNPSPPWGEAGRGAKPQALKSSSFDGQRTRRGPLIAASLFGAVVLAWFGWQLLIKYQRDKDGNTTVSLEAKGGDETETGRATAKPATDADKEGKRSATKPSAEKTGLIGPVQIEYLDGLEQIVVRGDPRDVERTIEVIKKIEAGGANKPENMKRALEDQGVKTDGHASSNQIGAMAQVFKLKYAKASETIKLLQKVFGQSGTRIEAEDRSNSIIAMTNSDTLATIGELLKALDQPKPQQQQPSFAIRRSLPEMEAQAKNLNGEIERAESELSKDEKELERLSKLAADLLGEGKDTKSTEYERRRLSASVESLRKRQMDLRDQRWALTQEIASIKARYEAIDRGEYPEALIMAEIRNDPQLVDLRKRIEEAEELYDTARSAAKYPTVPAVRSASTRLAKLREAEEQLKEELRHAALLRLRWGPVESSPQAKGIVQGTQTSPGGQTKIFSLQNTRATEAYEMLRKLYPEDTVRMTTHQSTNQLIVEGDRETLDKIEAILLRLDESNAPRSASGPTKIDRSHKLRISVAGALAEAAINNLYSIDLDGYVNLGAEYGKIKVIGLTADQAQTAIFNKLREILREPKVVLSIEAASSPTQRSNTSGDRRSSAPVRIQGDDHSLRISAAGTLAEAPIDGVYYLDLDGYVNLGAAYGKIKVGGLTADEAQAAVLAELRKVLRDPKVTLTVEARDQPAKPATRGAEEQTESHERMLRELQEQLKFVEQQLNSQIHNVRDTLETKLLKRERDELQRQIIGLGSRLIEARPQDPLANHPELVQMRRRLGDLNLKISQERFRQEGAKESAYLKALISQAQRLQNDIWALEKTLPH